jgi:hypothetical protein
VPVRVVVCVGVIVMMVVVRHYKNNRCLIDRFRRQPL